MAQASPPGVNETRELVIRLYDEGKTYTEIGETIGRSRNAVAGLVKRIRDNGPHKASPELANPVPKRYACRIPKPKHEPRIRISLITNTAKAGPTFRAEPRQPRLRLHLVTDATAVTLAELEPHMCKFPLGDPLLSDFRYCGGNRANEKSPYCVWHAKICCQETFYRMEKRPQL